MPNSFQFIRRTTGEAEKFVAIDEELCAFLGVEVHPTKYYRGWYDGFGECAAMGMTFARMRAEVYHDFDEQTLKMLDWFDANFTTDAWYSPK